MRNLGHALLPLASWGWCAESGHYEASLIEWGYSIMFGLPFAFTCRECAVSGAEHYNPPTVSVGLG